MKNFKKITNHFFAYNSISDFINKCSLIDCVEYIFSFEDCDFAAICTDEDDHVLGFIFSYEFDDYIEVSGLVHPDYRKQHIFTQLLSMVLSGKPTIFSGRDYYPFISEIANHMNYTKSYREYLMKHSGPFAKDCDLYFEDDADTRYFYIADNENSIGRFSYLSETDRIDVFDVYVEPEYRQQGIGRQMMFSLSEYNVYLQVSEQNKAAMALYESCGFEIVNHILFLLK